MRATLTGDDIYSDILMRRGASRRTIFLVEGPTDAACLYEHVDSDLCDCLPCFGNINLDRAMALVDETELVGVVSLRDSDWLGVIDPSPTSSNVVLTDLYDIEATIAIRTSVGVKACYFFGDPGHVEAHSVAVGAAGPIEVAVLVASEIGVARALSHRRGLGLNTKGFPFELILGSSGEAVDRSNLSAVLIKRTTDCSLSVAELDNLLDEERGLHAHPERLVNGHDLVRAIAQLCRRRWGGSGVGADHLEQSIRFAVSRPDLERLDFFQLLEQWESKNSRTVWKRP